MSVSEDRHRGGQGRGTVESVVREERRRSRELRVLPHLDGEPLDRPEGKRLQVLGSETGALATTCESTKAAPHGWKARSTHLRSASLPERRAASAAPLERRQGRTRCAGQSEHGVLLGPGPRAAGDARRTSPAAGSRARHHRRGGRPGHASTAWQRLGDVHVDRITPTCGTSGPALGFPAVPAEPPLTEGIIRKIDC
jgi:hypothetical protein